MRDEVRLFQRRLMRAIESTAKGTFLMVLASLMVSSIVLVFTINSWSFDTEGLHQAVRYTVRFYAIFFIPLLLLDKLSRWRPLLPPVSMSDVCRFGVPIRILELHGVDGNIDLIELIVLNHLIAQRAPALIFELGTFDGRTTVNFAANARTDATVYTIDLPRSQMDTARLELDPFDRKYVDKDGSGARFAHFGKAGEAAKIIQLYGDTAAFDFSPWYGRADFVFVDASHASPYVRNDTEIALKLIGSRPGLIAWHDYNSTWTGVTEVLNDYYAKDHRLKNLVHIAGTTLAICEIDRQRSKQALNSRGEQW